MLDEDVWFEPKLYGYGAGLPVAWQGWALLAGYLGAIMTASLLLPRHWLAYLIVILALTAALLPICAAHTRGGWRWRWGRKE